AAEIANRNRFVLDFNLYLFAIPHDELIDGVINHLLKQDIAPVVVMRTVTDATNIHPSTQPDMFQRGKRFNFALVVNVLIIFCHSSAAPLSGESAALPTTKEPGEVAARELGPIFGVFTARAEATSG